MTVKIFCFVPTGISTKGLKDFALAKLPTGSPLREVLFVEDGALDAGQFVERMPVWLKLATMEDGLR